MEQQHEEPSTSSSSMAESFGEIILSLIEWSRRVSPNMSRNTTAGQDNMSYCSTGDNEGKFKTTTSIESKHDERRVTTNDDSITDHSRVVLEHISHDYDALSLDKKHHNGHHHHVMTSNHLEQELIHLQKGFNRLIQLSPEYDYKSDTPGNGVRSLLKLMLCFVKLWQSKVLKSSSTSTRKFKSMTDTTTYLNVVDDRHDYLSQCCRWYSSADRWQEEPKWSSIARSSQLFESHRLWHQPTYVVSQKRTCRCLPLFGSLLVE